MKVLHRYSDDDRQNFFPEKQYSFRLKPKLLHVGFLDKGGGWGEEPHSHAFLEIVFVTGGSGTTVIDGTRYKVKKGDLLVYNAGVTHFERSSATDPMEIVFVAYDKLKVTRLPPNWLLPASYGCVFPSGSMYEVIRFGFQMLLDEFERKDKFYVEIGQNISRTMLMYLFRLVNRTQSTFSLFDQTRIVETALGYIESNFREKITLDILAEECFTNKYHLSHLFTRVQGMSIGKYILGKRIGEAKRLLGDPSLPIEQVAERAGFYDPGYFCRVFKKETGVPPSAYRKKTCRDKVFPLPDEAGPQK